MAKAEKVNWHRVALRADTGRPVPSLVQPGRIQDLTYPLAKCLAWVNVLFGAPYQTLDKDKFESDLRGFADELEFIAVGIANHECHDEVTEEDTSDEDWRLSLSPELDKFARLILEKDSNMARRVIRSALGHYRKLLTDRSEREFPGNPHTTDLIERSNVAALLIELWDESDN